MARNGFLAEDGIKLVTVEDNDQLIATAAASFLAMRAAAAADGVQLWIVEPAGAYRSAWVQNDMVDNPTRYNLNPNSKIRFGRSGQSHGWGNRVDVNSAALPWMLRNAARFGWTREYGANDPNHFAHDGRTAISGAGASVGGIGTPEEQGDVEMRIIYNKDSSVDDTRRAIVGELTFQVITGPQSTRERKFWGEPVNVTVGEWDAARDLVLARAQSLGLPVATSGNGSVVVDYSRIQAMIPTAVQNGQAARDAIVKPS